MPDDLLSIYCTLTRSYALFDLYLFTQLKQAYDIYLISAQFLLWEYQLVKTPLNYFNVEVNSWSKCHDLIKRGTYSSIELKVDLVETLHFLIGKLNQGAKGKCLIIAGIYFLICE